MSVASWMTIGFIIYLLVMVYLSYVGWRRTKSIADFAIAGRAMGPWVVAFAYLASIYSTALYLGYPGWSYNWGASSLSYFITLSVAIPLGAFVVYKRYMQITTVTKALSMPDWVGARYNSNFLRAVVAIITLFNISYIAGQLAGSSKVLNAMMGLPYGWALAIVTIFTVAYVFFGGSFAEMYSDAVQGALMLGASILIFFSVFFVFPGGFGEVQAKLAAQDLKYVTVFNKESVLFYGWVAVAAMFFIDFALMGWPQLAKLFMALKKDEDVKKTLGIYVVINFIACLIFFGGLYARAYGIETPDIDKALPLYMMRVFPAFVAAIVGVAILAAAMSTADGLFIVISTAISNDIYRRIVVPRQETKYGKKYTEEQIEKRSVWMARIVVILIALGCFASLYVFPPWSVGLLIWMGIFGLMAGTVGPIYVGLYWKRGTPVGGIVSAFVGVIAYVIIAWQKVFVSVFVGGTVACLIGAATFVIVSLMTKPMDEEYVNRFFPKK